MPDQTPEQAEAIEAMLWTAMKMEARELQSNEPLLSELIAQLFPEGASLSVALTLHLANLLQAPGMSAEKLSALFNTIMTDHREIEHKVINDLQALRDRDPACTTYLHGFLFFKGFQALQAHRIAHMLWNEGRKELSTWLANRVSVVLGPDIHPAAQMGSGVMLDHGSGIVIGETTVVDDGVSIMQNVTLGGTGKVGGDRHPKIRRGVMIGSGASVLGNVEIGANSKVAAGSVVLKAIPPGCTVAGIPAAIVRIHDETEIPAISMDQNV